MNTQDNNRSRQGRIPATLQAVFLASNRGKDVNKPPPAQVASKVYFRNWLFQRQAGSKEKRGGLFGGLGAGLGLGKNKKNKKSESQPKNDGVESKVVKTPKPKTAAQILNPQVYMDAMIRSQGYSTRRFQSLESAYYNKPTPLQRASYDVYMIDAVKALDHEVLSAALEVGISPNPCNAYAESLVHMVSRRGDSKALQILVDNGCNLQVADDYGRTPFHDCCWAADPAFEVAEIILAADPRLFYMTDSRGAVPLSYVRKEHWPLWIEYLESKKHMLWPTRNIKIVGEEEAPTLTLSGANSRPLQDPENAVPVELAAMIASGKMTPGEAQFLKDDKTESTCDFSDSEDEDDDSDYDSDEEDDFGMDVGQMADILNGMPDPYEVGETSWTSW